MNGGGVGCTRQSASEAITRWMPFVGISRYRETGRGGVILRYTLGVPSCTVSGSFGARDTLYAAAPPPHVFFVCSAAAESLARTPHKYVNGGRHATRKLSLSRAVVWIRIPRIEKHAKPYMTLCPPPHHESVGSTTASPHGCLAIYYSFFRPLPCAPPPLLWTLRHTAPSVALPVGNPLYDCRETPKL